MKTAVQKKKLIASLLCSVAMLPMAAQEAMAQNSAHDSDIVVLEEIIVTAQKREQSQQDVPIAITTMTESMIAKTGSTEIKDLQFSTPGLIIVGTNPVQQQYSIRGVSDRGRNAGYDLRVGVYVDGVWVGKTAAANQSTLDVQSVEVLRGPQGTLFGKNTVAGAISINTKRPHDEFEATINGEYGNYEHWKVEGSINTPLSDNVMVKASVAKTQRDGYVTNVNPQDLRPLNNRNLLTARAQLLWEASDSTEVLVTYDHMESDERLLAAGENVVPSPFGAILGDENTVDMPHTVSVNAEQITKVPGAGGLSLKIDHELANEGLLTSISAWRYDEFYWAGNDEDYAAFDIAQSNAGQDSTHYSQEIRYASPASEKFDYIVGLFYLNQKIDGHGDAYINGLAPIQLKVDFETEVGTESFAAFTHMNYRFTDTIQLTAGARYTKEEKDLDYSIVNNTPFFTTGEVTDKRSATDFSPKMSVNWSVSDNVMTYLSWSKAFKSGGWNADFIADLAILPFDDESVTSWEAGYKSTLLDNRLRLNAAVYQSKHSDFQVFQQTPLPGGRGSALTVTNAGRLKNQGVEVEMTALLSDWISVWGTLGLSDAEFTSYPDCGPGGLDCTGNRPTEAPKSNYGLGADIDLPAFGGNFRLSSQYYWRGKYFSDAINDPFFESQSRKGLNARLSFTPESEMFELYIAAKNLTDNYRKDYSSVAFLGIPRAVYNPPRMYQAGLKVRFGDY